MLAPVDYDRHQHTVYAKARAISPVMLARWMDVFAGYLPPERPLSLIDLGSGAGRFTPALADAFGGPVWGVEPSAKMREVAERDAAHLAVTYLAGEAAHIPRPDTSVDAVLLFLSFHHAPDKHAAAREITRVLKPEGRVLMRGQFGDRSPACWWDDYFPSFRGLQMRMFPTLDETLDAFASTGLRRLDLREVEETYADSEADAVERLKLRGISVFDHLSESEIDEGFARIDADFAAGTLAVRLTAPSDLLVLG
jgi:ubiquinone/menaquinone biosynthesis C-methylase UbiE